MNLKNLLSLCALFVAASVMCFAESWNGHLIDLNCHEQAQGKAAACTPTAKTTSFGLETSEGKVVKLDSTGNMKAMQMMKTSANPDHEVTVNGSIKGETIKVDSIVAQP